jgi:hypothetical protein
MGFMDRAWNSAAEEYGRVRAEKYGRLIRIWRGVQVLAGIALTIGVIYCYHLGQG